MKFEHPKVKGCLCKSLKCNVLRLLGVTCLKIVIQAKNIAQKLFLPQEIIEIPVSLDTEDQPAAGYRAVHSSLCI